MTSGTLDPPSAPSRPTRLRWWREVLYSLCFYGAYTLVRDLRGTKPVSRLQAYNNAERVIDVEHFFGVFQERRIQAWFLHNHLVVRALDDFYGTAHFVITLVVLVFLFRTQPGRYGLWRNTLAITTALALVGFAFFPLMPPRLLPQGFHFVDTLRAVGGLWSFESGPMHAVSNQYAAMPSLHFAWALWSSLALAPVARRRWVRAALWAYPALTLVCIVVTANHYVLDAAGGAATVGLGYGAAMALTRAVRARTEPSPA